MCTACASTQSTTVGSVGGCEGERKANTNNHILLSVTMMLSHHWGACCPAQLVLSKSCHSNLQQAHNSFHHPAGFQWVQATPKLRLHCEQQSLALLVGLGSPSRQPRQHAKEHTVDGIRHNGYLRQLVHHGEFKHLDVVVDADASSDAQLDRCLHNVGVLPPCRSAWTRWHWMVLRGGGPEGNNHSKDLCSRERKRKRKGKEVQAKRMDSGLDAAVMET